jgi:aspartyl-tRNA(Asn)/glutamyl-tRNA(Gln) amidotransferase subunit B
MTEYVPTIGLEIHAQLSTETKMFCNSPNDPDQTQPNMNICPICVGHPGTLPAINKEAVRQVLRVGTAVDGELADFTEFDRKNYFYPDLPKGYQISQYEHPLVSGGELAGVEITRIHLEEDTGTNVHKDGRSFVDYNRAGTPLMELVTEPVIEDAGQAERFARELQLLLQTLESSEANLEKGEMRVEANVSLGESREKEDRGTKVEVKNLNSFKAVREAIAYEIHRQDKLLQQGKQVTQSTRGWDEDGQETFAQREKETSEDYRYFPDPDLPKLKISEIDEFGKDRLKESLPELPAEARSRLGGLGIDGDEVETLITRIDLKTLFDDALEQITDKGDEQIRLLVNYITSDLIGLEREQGRKQDLSGQQMAELIEMIIANDLSSRGAKDTLEIMFAEGGQPEDIASEHELLQTSDTDELEPIIDEIIQENPDVVAEYKGGKKSTIQYFIGQGMQKTGGSANPEVLKKLFQDALDK